METGPAGFARAFFLTAALLLGTVSSTNALADPLDLYPWQIVPPVVMAERDEKARLISEAEERPEILVLGSSRSMKLRPALIQQVSGRVAFNASVYSARAEDWYAMLRFTLEQGVTPKYVLLGVDLEAFHNRVPPDSRLLRSEILSPYLSERESVAERVKALLFDSVSLQNLRHSWKSLTQRFREPVPARTAFEADGYLRYLLWEDQIRRGSFVPDYDGSVEEYLNRYAGFTELSPERKLYFEKLLVLAKENGVQIIAFQTPLHQRTMDSLKRHRQYDRLEAELQAFMESLAGQHRNLRFLDLSDVTVFGGDPADFYDGAHMGEQNADLLVLYLLKAVQPNAL